jgi:hypothetical protein
MRFPPAWYPDPTGRHDHRWWDGGAWTAHVADAGVAGTDPVPPAAPAAPSDPAAHAAPVATGAAPGTTAGAAPGVAVAALVVGIAAALLGWVPFLGLVVAAAAVVLGVFAMRRTRGARGRGMATVGVVAATLAVLTAIATTTVAGFLIADGTGGRLGAAARAYVACLEKEPQEVCERRLTEDLLESLGG